MATKLLFGHDQAVAAWVGAQMEHGTHVSPDTTAIGVVRDGRLIGGVAFHTYRGTDIQIAIAGYENFLGRQLLRATFSYVFDQLGCQRCTTLVKRTNKRSRHLTRRVGFREEGALRRCFEDGATGILYGATREDVARWLDKPQDRTP